MHGDTGAHQKCFSGKKNEKKRTGLAQKEEIQKNEKSKDKKVLKKGGWEEKRINTVAYSQLRSIPSMDLIIFSPQPIPKKNKIFLVRKM